MLLVGKMMMIQQILMVDLEKAGGEAQVVGVPTKDYNLRQRIQMVLLGRVEEGGVVGRVEALVLVLVEVVVVDHLMLRELFLVMEQ